MRIEMPKEVVVELLQCLAEGQKITELDLGGRIGVDHYRACLRELAARLQSELEQDRAKGCAEIDTTHLSRDSHTLLAKLSPREGRQLLRSFGFSDH